MTPGVPMLTGWLFASITSVSVPAPPSSVNVPVGSVSPFVVTLTTLLPCASVDRHVRLVRVVDQLEGRRRIATGDLGRQGAAHRCPRRTLITGTRSGAMNV